MDEVEWMVKTSVRVSWGHHDWPYTALTNLDGLSHHVKILAKPSGGAHELAGNVGAHAPDLWDTDSLHPEPCHVVEELMSACSLLARASSEHGPRGVTEGASATGFSWKGMRHAFLCTALDRRGGTKLYWSLTVITTPPCTTCRQLSFREMETAEEYLHRCRSSAAPRSSSAVQRGQAWRPRPQPSVSLTVSSELDVHCCRRRCHRGLIV